MGLDMYLTKKTYVKNWSHMKEDELHHITITGPRAGNIKPERIMHIEEEVGYWHKANAIHSWFVHNVQDGNDDCGEYYVSHEQLAELLELVKSVLDKIVLVDGKIQKGVSHQVRDILPTADGYFFGSTDYDQWYVEDLKRTAQILDEALRDAEGEYYYHASW